MNASPPSAFEDPTRRRPVGRRCARRRPAVHVGAAVALALATLPALADAAIAHFTCYKTRRSAGAASFTPIRDVALDDQIGSLRIDVKQAKALCVPTDKNDESPGAGSHPDVLMCYAIKRAAGATPFATLSP